MSNYVHCHQTKVKEYMRYNTIKYKISGITYYFKLTALIGFKISMQGKLKKVMITCLCFVNSDLFVFILY